MSRTYHHYWRKRKALHERKELAWCKIYGGPGVKFKRVWVRQVRNYHKREMLRDPEDPVLSKDNRISDNWDWF